MSPIVTAPSPKLSSSQVLQMARRRWNKARALKEEGDVLSALAFERAIERGEHVGYNPDEMAGRP